MPDYPYQQVQSELSAMGLTAYTYEDITVATSTGTGAFSTSTTTSTSFSTLTSTNLSAPASFVALVADGGTVRFTRNNQVPGTNYGIPLLNQGVIQLTADEASNLMMVTTSTAGVVVHVEYYAPIGSF